MEKTSVQMEQDMLDDLDKIAEIEEKNRSQVIRKANKDYIATYREKYGAMNFDAYEIKGEGK